MNVKINFLHDDLKDHIYMENPKGFNQIGYMRCEYDCCVYLKSLDDMLIVTNHLCDINELKIFFGKEFDMKDLGDTKKILGMEIYKDKSSRKLWLS
ncbi:hypothetical protein CR513_33271, partial [Mucuna pruriens]